MKLSLQQEYKLPHIMALALIVMCLFFIGLIFLPLIFPLFETFVYNIFYYFAIVPIGFLEPFIDSTIEDPQALPNYDGMILFLGFAFCTIYTFFFALMYSIISKNKVISLAYVGFYIVLAIVLDKLIGHTF